MRLLLIVPFLCLYFTLNAQWNFTDKAETYAQTDWQQFNLKGKVKEFRRSGGMVTQRPNGGRERQDSSKVQYKPLEDLICAFDEHGYTIHLDSKFPHDSTVTKYNKDGRRSEATGYKPGTSAILDRKFYKYDKAGNLVKYWRIDLKKKVKHLFKFDANGDEILSEYRKLDSLPFRRSKTTYIYNEKGLKTEGRQTHNNGRVVTWSYTYDGDGNTTIIDNSQSHILDSIGRIVEWKQQAGKTKSGRTNYGVIIKNKYDEQDNMIEQSNYTLEGELRSKHTSVYEFDSTGNWITQTNYKDGNKIDTITRVITYY